MPRDAAPGRSLEVVSPLSAIVFAALGWFVFPLLIDNVEPSNLPGLTRGFFAVQPAWLAAGLLGAALSTIAEMRRGDTHWKRWSARYAAGLAFVSVFNIGWGIIAMYLLSLPPADL